MTDEELQSILADAQRAIGEETVDIVPTAAEPPTQEVTTLGESDVQEVLNDMGVYAEEENEQPIEGLQEVPNDEEDFAITQQDMGLDVETENATESLGFTPDSQATSENAHYPADLREELNSAEVSQLFPSGEPFHETSEQEAGIMSIEQQEEARETTNRFRGAEWFKIAAEQEVVMAGLGGIGSWAAFILSRIRPKKLYLYDPDFVEAVNMSGQLYGIDDVARAKVSAISAFMANYSDYNDVLANIERFTSASPGAKVMISGFDNMHARKEFYGVWKRYLSTVPRNELRECLFIDARMAAETIQILCMTGLDESYMREYEDKWLFLDSEADTTVCSYKQTSYCAAIIGGLINNLFVNFCTNLSKPLIDRTIPFFTEYEASTMYLNVKV